MGTRAYEISYTVSKIWAGLCYFFTAFGWFELVNNEVFKSLIDQISFVVLGLTIASIPLAILKYLKQSKEKQDIKLLK